MLTVQKENGPIENHPDTFNDLFGNLDFQHQMRMQDVVQTTLSNIQQANETHTDLCEFLNNRLLKTEQIIESTFKIEDENHQKNEVFWQQKSDNQNVRVQKIEMLDQKLKALQEKINQFEKTNY
jgi:DNA-directed RNA polymerase subunit L